MRKLLGFLLIWVSVYSSAQSVQFGGSVSLGGQVQVSSAGAPAPPPPLRIITTALPSAQANSAYIPFTILTQNGVGTVSCGTITGMPTGMTINSSCAVTGTSSVAGNFPVTGIATDSKTPTAQTAAFSFTLSITCPPLSIVSALTLPNGTQNQVYGPYQLLALGGILPLTWTQPSGTMPTGTTVSSSGSVGGTPTNTGTFAPGIQVSDSCPVPQTTPVSTFSLTVVANVAPLSFVTTTIPPAAVESAYSSKIQVKGGTPPYTLSQTAGSLFLPMDSTGVVSGTVEDIMDWISIDSRRTGQHLTGTGNPHYSYIDTDGTKFWSQKGSGGNPWDIFPYGTTGQTNACPNDANGAPMFCHWITENGDENAFTSARAYKRLVTPIALVHRYFDGNSTESNTTAGPNPLKRTLNCELDGEATINLGQAMGAREAIVTTPWGGAVGTQRTLVIDWSYTFSGGVYQNREQFYYVKGWGLVQWQNEQWNGSAYIPSQTVTDTTLTAGGAPTPNFPCYGTTPGWIGGAPGAGGNATAFKAATPAMSATATVQVSDSLAATASQSFTLNVDPLAFADNRYCTKGDVPNFGVTTDGPATLPTACINTALASTPSLGATVTATAGSFSSVQSLVNAASCGDTIMPPALTSPGVQAVYSGALNLPAKACDTGHYVTIITDQAGNLPPEGTRISPAWIGIPSLPGRPNYNQPTIAGIYLPQFRNPSGPAMTFANGGKDYRLIGLDITSNAGQTVGNLVNVTGVDHVIFDRDLCHGGNSSTGQSRDAITRCFSLSGSTSVAVVDSYIYDVHASGIDSQGILAGGCSASPEGPFKFVNDFIEASGENIFAGGCGAGSATLTPADYEIRRVHLFKPLFWRALDPSYFGTNFTIKNCFELKNATRVLIEGVVCEDTWTGQGDQAGYLFQLGPKNQSQGNGGSASSDNAGNITWVSGAQFSTQGTSSNCSVPLHCLFKFNGIGYRIQTVTDATHLTVSPFPPATTSASYTEYLPGQNPNAAVTNVTLRYSVLRHANNGIAVFAIASDGGDFGAAANNFSFHDLQIDDIDPGKWAAASGSCCNWGNTFEFLNDASLSQGNLHHITVKHVTALPSLSGFGVGFGPSIAITHQNAAGSTIGSLQIYDNIFPGGFQSDTPNQCAGSAASLNTATLVLNCIGAVGGTGATTWRLDHNGLAQQTLGTGICTGPNKSLFCTGNNPPYPAGNLTVADYTSILFTSLNGANGGNYHLQLASPFHNQASDGTDMGANIDLVNQYTAGVP